MTNRTPFVVTVAAVSLAIAACSGGPGTTPATPTTLPHVGVWYLTPQVKVTLTEDAFTIAAGDGTMPLGAEDPFNAVSKIVVSGTLAIMDNMVTLTVDPDPDSFEIEYVDPAHAAEIQVIVGPVLAAAASTPVTAEINLMHAPPTMTVVARLINRLVGLPNDARIRACKDMPCSAQHVAEWWNSLNAEQMVAALYGDMATPMAAAAAKMMYKDLDPATRMQVDLSAVMINGHVSYDSVGAWWESLNCREMRIAAGDGNTTDPTSAYCAHYPGSGHAKILSDAALAHVNKVGKVLLGRTDTGTFSAPG